MPIYEYHCQDCGERSEIIHKISDPDATNCPKCHQQALRRLVSATQFQLKGTGWYVTDFKDKKSQKRPDSKIKTSTQSADSNKSETTKKEG